MSDDKIPHGTRSGYRYWRCHCAECRAWNAGRQARYIERHPEKARPNGWARYNGVRQGQRPYGTAA